MQVKIIADTHEVAVKNDQALTVADAVELCESALSAYFGYGVKIIDWDTYIHEENE